MSLTFFFVATVMVLFKTEFNGYAVCCFQKVTKSAQVKFSPFDEDKIAVATAQNFGLAGRLQSDSH